ncbi:hypothetical protein ACVWY2_006043 [Bradyrhizobium sp. JR6.1]
MEGRALIVERQRMPCPLDLRAENPVRQLERPHPVGDAACHLVDRQAIGRDGVPDADELDRWHRLPCDLRIRLVALKAVQHRHKDVVAQRAEQHLDAPDRVVARGPVRAIGFHRAVVQFGFGAGDDQALIEDECGERAHGECAAAESEQVDLRIVLVVVVAADEFVGIQDIALEAVAEGAAEQRERDEGRRADAVIILGGLRVALQIQRLEYPPDIGAPDAGSGVAGAVGQDNDLGARHRKTLAEVDEADGAA